MNVRTLRIFLKKEDTVSLSDKPVEGLPPTQVNPDVVGRRCLIYLYVLSAPHIKTDMK